MIRIIIESSVNIPPEQKIQDRIDKLGEGWTVKCATTAMLPSSSTWSSNDECEGRVIYEGLPKHIFYTTTVILEKATP